MEIGQMEIREKKLQGGTPNMEQLSKNPRDTIIKFYYVPYILKIQDIPIIPKGPL